MTTGSTPQGERATGDIEMADAPINFAANEPRGVVNTGDRAGAVTAQNDVWI